MDPRAEPPRQHGGLRAAWSLARPYWRNDRIEWGMLAALVASTLAIVWINVRFSDWNNAFYDALQAHDLGIFWRQLLVFGVLAAAYIALAVVRLVVQQHLLIRWREGMTEHLLALWLRPGTPCRVGASELDNPDQRLTEDIRSFAGATLDIGLGLLNAVVTLLSFIFILWRLSGRLHVPWPSPGWELPGHLVWIAILYSAAGSAVVHRLGAPLAPANARQQQVEADFRYALVQVRDHAEAIALARGEPAEHHRLRTFFGAIRANWTQLIGYNKRLAAFNAGYGQVAGLSAACRGSALLRRPDATRWPHADGPGLRAGAGGPELVCRCLRQRGRVASDRASTVRVQEPAGRGCAAGPCGGGGRAGRHASRAASSQPGGRPLRPTR